MNTPVAVVAGAGSGLGQATAIKLHEVGYNVVAIDRSEPGLKGLPDGIRRLVADVTNPTVAGPLFDRIAAEVGTPQVLVNTVGTFAIGDAMTTTPDTLNELMAVNVGTALWLTQASASHMKAAGAGVIIHVAARPGIEPTADLAAYGASKAALVHLVRTLDLELRPHGVRVNAIAPQVIATAKNRANFPPEALVGAVEPDAIADVVAFLVSDKAAAVNGAIVPTYGH
jgi:NAD(P)-dependent dehydrogenase (short-subunit alcohol dehydrogenase family)